MIIVIGAGPAGYLGAITAKTEAPHREVMLLERGNEVLRKVKISGGGRCNVTHDCADPVALSRNYPRGGRVLRGAFGTWGPPETRDWFASRGVQLKTEADGRVFPVSDSSATIVDCLRQTSEDLGVVLKTGCPVQNITAENGGLKVTADGQHYSARAVLLATGGGHTDLAASLGHSIIQPVPSLFTFNSAAPLLQDLAGVAVPRVMIRAAGQGIPGKGLPQEGPLLITHWGVSGPAVLKLSAWAARLLHDCQYTFDLRVDWCPDLSRPGCETLLQDWATGHGRKQVSNSCPVDLPRRLWTSLVGSSRIPVERRWGEVGSKMIGRLIESLKDTRLPINGKSTFKDEFVTCGGVDLAEVDFGTMGSKVCPGLYLAGEMLDIDGITGGFNFQGCWTTGRLAGLAMASLPR